MQEILTLMYSKGDGHLAKTVPNWARAPWLEHVYFKDMLQADREPRLLTTHLPCHVLAPALKKAKAKVSAGPHVLRGAGACGVGADASRPTVPPWRSILEQRGWRAAPSSPCRRRTQPCANQASI